MRCALPGGFLTTGLAGSRHVVRIADADRGVVAPEGLTPPAVSMLYRNHHRVAGALGSALLSLLAANLGSRRTQFWLASSSLLKNGFETALRWAGPEAQRHALRYSSRDLVAGESDGTCDQSTAVSARLSRVTIALVRDLPLAHRGAER